MRIIKIAIAFLLTMFIALTPAYSQYAGAQALQEKPSIQCGNVKDKVSLSS